MCRIEIGKDHIEKVYKAAYNKEELSEFYEYSYLFNDVQSNNKKNSHKGYSVMLFAAITG
jgi:hypothetical protein